MIYDVYAQDHHFFDFVFYETEKNKMFVYCPNCNGEYEIDMRLQVPKHISAKVAWIKKNYTPCDCFVCKVPRYYRTDCEYANVGTEGFFGEFRKNSDGSVTVEVYRQTTNFAASNYCCDRPFRRQPVFETNNSIDFTFREGEKIKIETCLYHPMMTQKINVGYRWHSVKKWSNLFEFVLLEESLKELKGTYLEKYIPDLYKFQDELGLYTNLDNIPMGEYTVQFLRLLCENNAFQKVWGAGFYTLAIQRVFESMLVGNNCYGTPTYYVFGAYIDKKYTTKVLNWRGKTLEKILKVNIQKLDNLFPRKELNFDDLTGAIKLEKYNLSYSLQNIQIAQTYRLDALVEFCSQENISIVKTFKYLRNQLSRAKLTRFDDIVSDYYDYLGALKELGTPLTADVVFPTALAPAHDRAVAARKVLQDKLKASVFKKVTKKYKVFNFENDKYKVYVVNTIEGLAREAQNLHNCSAGYVDRIINGSSVIFLIREKAHLRKSFFMLELNPHTLSIVQNRGYCNRSADDQLEAFAEQWQKSVVVPTAKKLNKLEKKKTEAA